MKSRVATVAAAILLGPMLGVPAASATPADGTNLYSCRPASFETAEVVPGAVAGTLTLIVTGMKPDSNTKIGLEPLVYVRQPEYWQIKVIGCYGGGFPMFLPYTTKLDVTHTVGTVGIVVEGSDGSVKIPLVAEGTRPQS